MKVGVVDGEGGINWQLLRKVYRHATRKVSLPEPHQPQYHANSGLTDGAFDVQRQLEAIVDEIMVRNEELLELVEQQTKRELAKLHQRIEQMEKQLQQIQLKQQGYQQSNCQTIHSTPSSRSFIYIEDQSLPARSPQSPQMKQKDSLETSRCNTLRKSQQGSADQNGSMQMLSQSESRLSYTYTDHGMEKQSWFQMEQNNLRKEVEQLKHLMEVTHNITIYDYPPTPKRQQTKTIDTMGNFTSTAPHQHLVNENQALRTQLGSLTHLNQCYKQQLMQTHHQLQEIRLLLHLPA